ncbi:PREDICTED: uncharacterized protein LOC104743246 [Camelina sativa]|uniref:Uncharacterized protein LOC104743246 n=1 Tax=Camelina sativa TaxID=90675 RepID=A0ABM0VXQ7_CAMSA|nr:PREDICTED: uncharacterized protein LOC104743246 [Camelina sativa]
MNVLMWNERGANKPNFQIFIRYMLKKFKTNILALFEAHVGGDRAGRICQGLGFDNSFRVDAVGQSGGLWLLWRFGVGPVKVVEANNQFIYSTVGEGTDIMHLVVVYTDPTVSRRSGLWDKLREMLHGILEPVVVGGDFNTILRLDERTGGNGRVSLDSLAFGEWVNASSLTDMGFKGSKFTWRRGCVESTYVAKRLDRVFCNAHARLKWQDALVLHLPFLASDYAPLFLQLSLEVEVDPRRRPFRFKTALLQQESFKEMLMNS